VLKLLNSILKVQIRELPHGQAFAIYQQPVDTAAFDDYCFSQYVPLANTLPGLRSDEATLGEVMRAAGKYGVDLMMGKTRLI